MKNIKIGTLVAGNLAEEVIPKLVNHGFETFSITFFKEIGDVDITRLAKKVLEHTKPRGITISSIGFYSNPLTDHSDYKNAINDWEMIIDTAHLFETDLVTGFTGRIIDESINKSIPKFKSVFSELSKRAQSKGLKIAFENCPMGGNYQKGNWNIAHNPIAWEMMFNALPNDNLGLQWEPCHQMVQLIDPIPQLKKWVGKIMNIHGKDATIEWDKIKENGIDSPEKYAWHRTPGFGDSNWTDIISILRMNNYEGSIDIEGYHDPVYKGEWELTGQLHALNYLKHCRGGDFIKNPSAWDKK